MTKEYRTSSKETVKLKAWPTQTPPIYTSEKDYEKLLETQIAELSSLQSKLYASERYSILVIFQGMDAAGKDGAIRHVMSGINPEGCEVFSFKEPSQQELKHDFLWRTTLCLPERGRIGIFNRSYYEEVLITRVHPDILKAEMLPDESMNDKNFWKDRFQSIVNFEEHLHLNGTRIVKIFLHLSKKEQRQRFLQRIDKEDKNWKFTLADIKEREYWHEYEEAYEDCLNSTSTKYAPWHIVPADDKKNARLIVSKILLKTLNDLNLSYPTITAEKQQELQAIRKLL